MKGGVCTPAGKGLVGVADVGSVIILCIREGGGVAVVAAVLDGDGSGRRDAA